MRPDSPGIASSLVAALVAAGRALPRVPEGTASPGPARATARGTSAGAAGGRRGGGLRAANLRPVRGLRTIGLAALLVLVLAGCGSGTSLLRRSSATVTRTSPALGPSVGGGSTPGATAGAPELATKNTTRIDGATPIDDAAQVALTVFPSAAPGTHPTAVTLAPSDDWQAALAASVFMASPIHAPLLFSGSGGLPAASARALASLAPAGASSLRDAQVIRIGDVAAPKGVRAANVSGANPYALAAGIDQLIATIDGRPSINVVIASGTQSAYAMPAAGWAAESGEPILFVDGASIPAATRQALLAHQRPHIYVLGPPSVIPDSTLASLRRYGSVKRIQGATPAANSVAFARYRDPACTYGQPCAHVPGSFGWAIDSPGHGYVLLNGSRPLDAAAAAPLSGSGDYGPQLVTADASTLPSAVLNYFLSYAEPGYNQEGPTAAVYNHGWVIGDPDAISIRVQAEMDQLLEVVPQHEPG